MRLPSPGLKSCPPFSIILIVLVYVASLVPFALAKDAKPRIVQSDAFPNAPSGLFYFEDSNIILLLDRHTGEVHRTTDGGEKWEVVGGGPKGHSFNIVQHPFDRKRAYILGREETHWYTNDQGESWNDFTAAAPPIPNRPLKFHAGNPDKIIFQALACRNILECDEVALYTTDGFRSEPKLLRYHTRGCNFARASELFSTAHEMMNEDRIFCVVQGRFSPFRKDYRLVRSDNYFTDEVEPNLEPGRTVKGLVSVAEAKRFMVAAAKAEGTSEMALYVTNDSETWHRAVFPVDHRVEQDAYTLLESTSYSIQLDVMNTKPSSAMGILMTSNSNGTYFTQNIEHTNRNVEGLVDFEQMTGIQGIILVNRVKNWEEVEQYGALSKYDIFHEGREKQVQSRISFDDGRNFHGLSAGKKDLHLHSVTNLHNSGRVFSSPAPGLVMGVGNTGEYLKPYDKGDLYISDDAGETWRLALEGPHKHEFGDSGSVLVALPAKEKNDKILYSIDHGKHWESADLGDEVDGLILTTTPDSTSLKFLVLGVKEDGLKSKFFTFSIDFEGLHERKCKEEDFEDWYARTDGDGKPACVMGQEQYFRRRKADVDCFIQQEFKDVEPEFKPCPCTDADYECDFNFVKKGDKCEPADGGRLIMPDGACENDDDTFEASSGYRLIAGNNCTAKNGVVKDGTKKWDCKGIVKPPANKDIATKVTSFKAKKAQEYLYLERTASSGGEDDEETIVLRTNAQEIFITTDHGKEWKEIEELKGKKIEAVWPHSFINDRVYFLADSETVYYSLDRGKHIKSFEAPTKPTKQIEPLAFHPHEPDWMIWNGASDCDSESTCHVVSSVTTERGDDWDRKPMIRYVTKCEFIDQKGSNSSQLIYCAQHQEEDNKTPLQLVSSNDFFKAHGKVNVIYEDLVKFTTQSEYVVVASMNEEKEDSLKVDIGTDRIDGKGKEFADALFPPKLIVPHQHAYTVLKGSSHALTMHVTVNGMQGQEYGSIISSNSNGTSYTLSLSGVNRDEDGYVDFEMMEGLEGVAITNVVYNRDDVEDGGAAKKLKSMITHNDGAQWDFLKPDKGVDGDSLKCAGDEGCSLHIHSYTERKDWRDTFYSGSAIGLMIGVGNIGEYLGANQDADTFMTRDGGVTWNMIKKGRYMWEYGDQGSIIVVVAELEATNVIWYSLDEGDSWTEYPFMEQEIRVTDITTVPSDDSRNFLLWGLDDGKLVTVNIDFSGLESRSKPCVLDEQNPEAGDYKLWTPKHPSQEDNCLFGHVSQYHRKRVDAECFNGRKRSEDIHDVARNCSCTNLDFECDYNYERQRDGSCQLAPDHEPIDHSRVCAEDPDRKEWFEPTGFRRTPLTTCEGGKDLERRLPRPCPGHEAEFTDAHGGRLSGFALFLVIVLPIALAASIGYWVWRNWDGKFGQIRLGDGAGGASFDTDSPIIKYPIMAVAVVVAVLISLPDVLARAWGSVRGLFGGVAGGTRTYTSRSAFARQRYDVVDEDEGELLGDESDEEV
ncbi:MAG: vacuolar protein sorting/targeting protein PEP1 [Piccolia ochrophora]|nr:MAG: vacuolar protein sorting/targeting protein PEP1 [Piccolia ochrophora]